MSDDVKMTRSEELRLKERIELAESGHDILEKKRDGLIHEFMEIISEARSVNEELAKSYIEAKKKIKMAKIYDGEDAVRSAALSVDKTPELESSTQNIMGVIVPEINADQKITKDLVQREYSLGSSSSRIDSTAERYEELLENIVDAAETQTRILKLLEEIEKTKRRVNALEHKVIPKFKDNLAKVSQGLEESEREETFRMKKIKEMQEE